MGVSNLLSHTVIFLQRHGMSTDKDIIGQLFDSGSYQIWIIRHILLYFDDYHDYNQNIFIKHLIYLHNKYIDEISYTINLSSNPVLSVMSSLRFRMLQCPDRGV